MRSGTQFHPFPVVEHRVGHLAQHVDAAQMIDQPDGLADIWWVAYLDEGDNKTKMINPVTSVRQIGPWLGGKAEIDLPSCESGCVLVVQEAGMGRVLATLRPE
jgi:hypothetical protein